MFACEWKRIVLIRPRFKEVMMGNKAACVKVEAPETQFFCAEKIMKQLEVDCKELRGQFSYEDSKYFPAMNCLHLVRAQRLLCWQVKRA